MSSPATLPDKETLKLLLPLRYDGKTVIECNRCISQLLIYWVVALSLLDGDARTWATPIFAQLAAVQVQIQGATTPFANEAAFLTVFKARFGNLDDAAAAQVELTKLCADKSLHEKRTTAEFSALFKGPADRSGYGDLELRDKYLSGIPSRVYRKIELETFTTWEAADKRATEVEQQLDISRACRPELNSFFSARERGRGGARGGAPHSPGASASINAAVGDRRQAPLGPDTPLFDSRIPPNTSISPSTFFDIFDGARRLLEARHGRPDVSRVDLGTSSAFSEQ
ncbi:hypothetical protein IEO21_10901 [Rhodonia placenta]|uniref:Retrotransposon gag domain-containing protein n=1 Tax=Rhodonia placenta TaxID=104341 RepID=A0A8H7NRM6_9APHY|nr:hypothetical protein IEO21_10901 [Postia placenta]